MKNQWEAKKENADHEELGYIDPCKSLSLEEAKQRIANGEKYVVRQTIPSTGVTSFDDEVYGRIEVDNSILDESVLLKSDAIQLITSPILLMITKWILHMLYVVTNTYHLHQSTIVYMMHLDGKNQYTFIVHWSQTKNITN